MKYPTKQEIENLNDLNDITFILQRLWDGDERITDELIQPLILMRMKLLDGIKLGPLPSPPLPML